MPCLALTCQIGAGVTATLLHLFDAAGERFRAPARHDEMGFLSTAQGLVYVLDPFSLTAVTDRLSGIEGGAAALSSGGDPEGTYNEVLSRLRGSGVRPNAQRLAVAVSRADLLQQHGLAPAAESSDIRAWLYEAGLHNLTLAAEREFADVRYFLIASQSSRLTTRNTDPGAPLRWLLSTRGLNLPDPLVIHLPDSPQDTATPVAPIGNPLQTGRHHEHTSHLRGIPVSHWPVLRHLRCPDGRRIPGPRPARLTAGSRRKLEPILVPVPDQAVFT